MYCTTLMWLLLLESYYLSTARPLIVTQVSARECTNVQYTVFPLTATPVIL
jgi:hypothetical protein